VIRPENLPDYEKTYPNRWMEDRNLRNLHTRVNSVSLTDRKLRSRDKRELSVDLGGGKSHQLNLATKNEKYMAIIYEFVKPEYAWKVLKWLNTITEDNKKVSLTHQLIYINISLQFSIIFVTYLFFNEKGITTYQNDNRCERVEEVQTRSE